jgi:2,3-bisphosphoglycerate-independent phosphoglycerate mutase
MNGRTPVVLCILDGWGLRAEREANAVALAETPNFDRIWATCPHASWPPTGRTSGCPRGRWATPRSGT